MKVNLNHNFNNSNTYLIESTLPHLLPHLTLASQQNLMASRSLRNAVLVCTEEKEIYNLRHLIASLLEGLEPHGYEEERNELAEILANISHQNFSNLTEIKQYILEKKEELTNVIKKLSIEKINFLLEDTQTSELLKDLHLYSKIKNWEERVSTMQEGVRKTHLLQTIAENWARINNEEQALQTVNAIPKDYPHDLDREKALQKIALAFADTGRYDRAVAIAKTLKNPDTKGSSFKGISENLKNNGNRIKAIQVAMMMPNTVSEIRDDVLQEIAQASLQESDYTAAIEASKKISVRERKENTLIDVFNNSLEAGESEIAKAAAKKISNSETRRRLLQEIPRTLPSTVWQRIQAFFGC